LNIGQPGDGFTVVSAMRRTQPDCLTFILTGYPALESALQAIRSQVDDYLLKPTHIPQLVDIISDRLKNRLPRRPAALKRISAILRENTLEIALRTLEAMKKEPQFATLPLRDEERIGNLPRVIESLAEMLESPRNAQVERASLQAACWQGQTRLHQGYSIPMLASDIRLLQRSIDDIIEENLMSADLSYLMFDLKRLHESLAIQLAETLSSYVQAQGRAA
jgi:YesN/AraC family two-component response regulator